MSKRSQTIEIFLPDGEPRGVRIAGITTRIVQAMQCPRTKLDRLFARPESQRVSLYFLFGASSEGTKPQVYIGQTENLIGRLKSHHSNKDFWTSVVAVNSRIESFTQVHVRYLEWLSIDRALEADRFQVENGNAGGRPFIPEPLESDVLDAFETAATLVAMLGFSVFDPLVAADSPTTEDELFHCDRGDAKARGMLVDDGFVVLKGSLLAKSIAGYMPKVASMQQEMRENNVLFDSSDTQYELAEDYLFNSPSQAAAISCGLSSNGWVAWKNLAGKTLDEVYRDDPAE